ncbi:hypothetical protein [Pendulispora albinea]|uniref:Uncharacterized protein n=1 Tax=Pendulispora albinea TaxID=2741071 RepID=A0ABZ2LXY4_9BACT
MTAREGARRLFSRALLVLTLATCAGLPMAACQDELLATTPCGAIPTGGCPRRGDACRDATCAALYTCSADGAWTRVQTCPARDGRADAAPSDAAPLDATSADPSDGSAMYRDASALDVPGASGGPGCRALEPPDCPLGRMATCPEDRCCGCEELFVCRGGGWESWGVCEGGRLVANSP